MARRRDRRGTIRETLANLATPAPLAEKARLFVRNNWIKLRTAQGCCGHPGEPGC